MPRSNDDDPPHARIAGDVVSCIFLNHSKKMVMKMAIPVSVKLLHRGNKELSRNLSSYLSLAAINNAEILAPHVQPIMDSIIGGNYSLVRVLPKIYSVKDESVSTSSREAIHDHVMALVCLLPSLETPDKLSLLNLFLLISKNKPTVLESNLPLFSEYLRQPQTAYQTLQIFLDMAKADPAPFVEYTDRVMAACDQQVNMLSLAAQFLGIVVRGRQDIERARTCIEFFVKHLSTSDLSTFIALLREIKSIVEVFPSLLPFFMPQLISETEHSTSNTVQNYLSQLAQLNQQVTATNGSVFRMNCDNSNNLMSNNYAVRSNANATGSLMRNLSNTNSARLNSSSSHVFHRSIPRLHVVNGGHIIGRHLSSSSNGVHMRSLTALQLATNSSSRQQMNRMSTESMNVANSSQRSPSSSCGYLTALAEKEAMKSSKTVATSVDSQLQSTSNLPSCISSTNYSVKGSRSELTGRQRSNEKSTIASSDRKDPGSFYELQQRDTLQQFCEKHIESIKSFMFKVFVKIPLPEKCTIEEKRTKKVAKLHFICQTGQNGGRNEHCLYSKTFFVMKTRNARLWIHLMFLAMQSKAANALSAKDIDVAALRNCWDALKADNKPFLTLVTSSFPSSKDQDLLMNELRSARYFDVFEFNAINNAWVCFLCNHPDRACEYLQNEPVIEGKLKEKKGRWKLFTRWRTRYFTLSGLQLSYREVDEANLPSTASGSSSTSNDLHAASAAAAAAGDTHAIGVGEIRSVRALGSSRGRRIPKAFEIFTEDRKIRLKANNSDQWVQCLSIAMAHSQAKEVS